MQAVVPADEAGHEVLYAFEFLRTAEYLLLPVVMQICFTTRLVRPLESAALEHLSPLAHFEI